RYAWQYLSSTGRAQLWRGIEAQLAAFAATGLRLAHLDGHLNMHLHPMVLPILLGLAPRFGIRAMRLSREDLGPALRYDRSHFPRKLGEGVVFHALAAYAAPRLRAAGIATADRVYGMHQTGHVDERYLLALVSALPPGLSEVYCHPARRDPRRYRGHTGAPEPRRRFLRSCSRAKQMGRGRTTRARSMCSLRAGPRPTAAPQGPTAPRSQSTAPGASGCAGSPPDPRSWPGRPSARRTADTPARPLRMPYA